MPDSYLIYLRKSRADLEAEQRGEGETLARHQHALLELAHRLHLDIGDIYREIVSGETIAARPVMQRLLAEVEEGRWAGVLVMEVERLARGDTIDQGIVSQAFKFSGTKIITPAKTYDPDNEFDEEYFEFGLFMSRREYKAINRRLQRGRVASIKEGKYVGSHSPFGYDRQKLEHDKGFTLTPNPDEAPVVQMIFELYTTGEPGPDGSMERLGVARIAHRLNDLKIPPKKGQSWNPCSIRDILTNPVYIGKLRWNWRKAVKRRQNGQVVVSRSRTPSDDYILVDGLHEPIIDKCVFAAVQEMMATHRAPNIQKKGVMLNPLAGLVVCGKCGRRMQRRPYPPNKRPGPSLICPYTSCSTVGSDLDLVEKRLLDALRDWLDEYTLQWDSEVHLRDTSAIDVERKAVEKLNVEYANLQKQRGNLHDLLERGIYDADTFLERSRNISERMEQVKEKRDAMRAALEEREQQEASCRIIIPKVAHLLAVYHQLPSPKAKNDALREVLEKVVYTKEIRGNRWVSADSFHLDLFPRVPRTPWQDK